MSKLHFLNTQDFTLLTKLETESVILLEPFLGHYSQYDVV